MKRKKEKDKLEEIISNFVKKARNELEERWKSWKLDLSKNEIYEVVGALMARQVTLSTQLARSPYIWNGHIAPIVLRAMADVYITVAWIIEDPLERSKKFINYGLGQMKLEIEHRKKQLEEDGRDPQKDPVIESFEKLLNSQRWTFLTEINIGQWAELNTRKMAEEAKCIDFYRYTYTPFSAAVHSMWHHILRYNLKSCKNPLHRCHHVPIDPDIYLDTYYFYLGAKYLEKTFKLFDYKFKINVNIQSAFQYICKELENTEANKA